VSPRPSPEDHPAEQQVGACSGEQEPDHTHKDELCDDPGNDQRKTGQNCQDTKN
jgi:hypothetical protein